MEAFVQNILMIPKSDSLKKIQANNEIIPKNGKGNVKDGTQMDTVLSMVHLAKESMLDGKFVRGEVEDLLTIYQDEETVWEEDCSNANWIPMGK